MTIYYQDDQTTIYHGDCIEVMRNMPENSVDSIVTDPPYGLGFMGAKWDALPPGKDWAEECLRVLKPGGHLLAFGGTRTWHRLAVAIEDAGFEIRDSVMWLYGSGFPKSHDVSKAIDKQAGKAAEWSGWGTALKPANEPIVMARKPFKLTVAANVLEHGTGAINIDACRVGDEVRKVAPINAGAFTLDGCQSLGELRHLASLGAKTPNGRDARTTLKRAERFNATSEPREYSGRWPANVILDEHMAGVLNEQTEGMRASKSSGNHIRRNSFRDTNTIGLGLKPVDSEVNLDQQGGASRFFYVAKASKKERPEVNGVKHATVKPLTLMRYLVRMVTPPNGIVLDPFAGSGTTIEAAILEGFQSIGIELTDEYLPLIQQRIQRQRVGAAVKTKYHVCDHPELLVKDETCFLCDQIDGQTDALNEVEW